MAYPRPGDTCKFYVSPEQTECGEEAEAVITTRITGTDQAKVPLCGRHKRQYDRQMADRRNSEKKRSA